MVKTPSFQLRECRFNPWLESKILHASGHSQKKKKKKEGLSTGVEAVMMTVTTWSRGRTGQ